MGEKFFLIGCCAGFDRHSAGYPERERNRPARRFALARSRQRAHRSRDHNCALAAVVAQGP